MKDFSVKKFSCSADIRAMSAGNFTQFIKERYPEVTNVQMTQLLKRFYGDDSGVSKKASKAR